MIGHAALVVGVLFAVAVYLMLSRRSQNVVMGFLLMSNGANLLVLTAAGLPPDATPPIVGATGGPASDPLPQAFLLTAIVIGLAAAAFLMALAARTHQAAGTDELGDRGRAP